MNISNKLKAKDDVIRRKFINLQSRRDLANLLEIEYGYLNYLLYYSQKTKYKTFSIPKRSGGTRKISSPIVPIKILQKKLAYILNLFYEPKIVAHGYIQGRCILTNSENHTRKNLILNIDLENFFFSINFGRVRGIFLSPPFNLDTEVATTIAQIACYENSLPQGSPLSPILSNIICNGLDYRLQKIAKENECFYTRYVDDITFSTNKKKFDVNLVYKSNSEEGRWILGKKIIDIIKNCGFQINNKKIKVRHKSKRQEVTGIIVNEFRNVRRSFIKEVLGMLNAWDTHGIENAEKYFENKYSKNIKSDFKKVLYGKIEFVKNVKGEKNPIYRKLINKFNLLEENGKEELPINIYEEIKSSICIIKSGGKQGTGFFIDKLGLVTCEHVIGEEQNIVAHKCNRILDKITVHLNRSDKQKDIAILDCEICSTDNTFQISQKKLSYGDKVTIAGFPNYKYGDQPRIIEDAKIAATRKDKYGNERYIVNLGLYKGESGGIVLDFENKIVGMVVTGIDSSANQHETAEYGIIPIQEIMKIADSPLLEIPKNPC